MKRGQRGVADSRVVTVSKVVLVPTKTESQKASGGVVERRHPGPFLLLYTQVRC